MEYLISRFFLVDDEKIDCLDNFEIPDSWWSRKHEYYWASKFLEKNDIILDAGCGVNHPFKDYACKRVRHCYALDNDINITKNKSSKKITFMHGELESIDSLFEEKKFDKIFCISVLEHMHPDSIIKTLENFKKVLKDDGKIILTIDHPFLTADHFINFANKNELIFASAIDYKIDYAKVLKGPYNGLKCYRAVLEKQNDREVQKIDVSIDIPEIEIKPEFPSEIKEE
jgi:SAM-dependent methyltransferase